MCVSNTRTHTHTHTHTPFVPSKNMSQTHHSHIWHTPHKFTNKYTHRHTHAHTHTHTHTHTHRDHSHTSYISLTQLTHATRIHRDITLHHTATHCNRLQPTTTRCMHVDKLEKTNKANHLSTLPLSTFSFTFLDCLSVHSLSPLYVAFLYILFHLCTLPFSTFSFTSVHRLSHDCLSPLFHLCTSPLSALPPSRLPPLYFASFYILFHLCTLSLSTFSFISVNCLSLHSHDLPLDWWEVTPLQCFSLQTSGVERAYSICEAQHSVRLPQVNLGHCVLEFLQNILELTLSPEIKSTDIWRYRMRPFCVLSFHLQF